MAGPFYPIDNLIEHTKGRCHREESLETLPVVNKIVESVGIVSLEDLVAPLQNGHDMKIQIVGEKNAQGAAFPRGSLPKTPRPVYTIFKQTCHPDHKKMFASGWPFDYIPALDAVVLGSFVSKEEANQEAREILEEWKLSAGPEESVTHILVEGCIVCRLSGVVRTQMLTVRFDDGRVDTDGVIIY
jgi:hypothetical protein